MKLKKSSKFKHTYFFSPVCIYHDKEDGTVLVSYNSDFSDEFEVAKDDLKDLKKIGQPINKVSETKKEDDKIYKTLRKVFLENKKVCELQLDGCTNLASEVHHLFSGGARSKYYLMIKEWKASCRNRHYIVHNILSKEQAIKLGLKKIE